MCVCLFLCFGILHTNIPLCDLDDLVPQRNKQNFPQKIIRSKNVVCCTAWLNRGSDRGPLIPLASGNKIDEARESSLSSGLS